MAKLPPIEHFWKKKGFVPNDNQREAILYTDGPLLLTAGPGSGKTRVLLWRTLNLIVYNNVDPKEIFLSTFTEKAAKQLKDGLKSLLAIVTNETGIHFDLGQMAIGTVHSICQSIITDRRFSEQAQRKHLPIISDQLSQYFTIYRRAFWKELITAGGFDDEETAQRTINKYLSNRESSSRHFAALHCISLFNRFSEEHIKWDKVNAKDEVLESLIRMYSFYLKSLTPEGKLRTADLSLLQQIAYEEITGFKGSINVFKHIIIDEYQDTNSIQEKIFFELAKGHKNICVVGDDDQALYRFRGATVENLVEFEARCEKYLSITPKRIDLDINYRSRNKIVTFYTDFIQMCDWSKGKGEKGFHRIADKVIKANSEDKGPSIVVTERKRAADVYKEIAEHIVKLKETDKIQDYNQVAFLFPAMKNNTRVQGFKEAFEALGVNIYAPRAGNFLNVEEAKAIFGLLLEIFDRPHYGGGISGGLSVFRNWMVGCMAYARELMREDAQLAEYLNDKKIEIAGVLNDFNILVKVSEKKKWDLKAPFIYDKMIRDLSEASGLSPKAKRSLVSTNFKKVIEFRVKQGKPFQLDYIINRTTSVDWSVLDLFYQLNGFKHFRKMYELAEQGTDEGHICNLGLVSQYLARFNEEYTPVITASFLNESKFVHTFFSQYTYALFRLEESEYEDKEVPFPKGRVPFLTIHQAKGLEFPVVVLGSVYKRDNGASEVEIIVRDILDKKGEPLDRLAEFDNMRMFYVGLSRAKNLLVLPRYTHGSAASEPFTSIFEAGKLPLLKDFDISSLPETTLEKEDLGKNYSYTADYLNYEKCPRQYMVFRKYGFEPSRSQTMFFGSLVHQTIEDLHSMLIRQKQKMSKP